VILYPTPHKTLHSNLSVLSSKLLENSTPKLIDEALLQASTRLSAVLFLTGGKVGAASLWTKMFETTVASAWLSLRAMRSTFPGEGSH
jgi:hypothetical protein